MKTEEVFRQKSLDKIKSPESLDDYIRVSNPGVWLLLVSVIVLLVGACVWGVFGRIDSTVPVTVQVENGKAVCLVTEENIKGVAEGMTVKFEGSEAVIGEIGSNENTGFVCELDGDVTLSDGFYEGKVVTESHKPLSFILN